MFFGDEHRKSVNLGKRSSSAQQTKDTLVETARRERQERELLKLKTASATKLQKAWRATRAQTLVRQQLRSSWDEEWQRLQQQQPEPTAEEQVGQRVVRPLLLFARVASPAAAAVGDVARLTAVARAALGPSAPPAAGMRAALLPADETQLPRWVFMTSRLVLLCQQALARPSLSGDDAAQLLLLQLWLTDPTTLQPAQQVAGVPMLPPAAAAGAYADVARRTLAGGSVRHLRSLLLRLTRSADTAGPAAAAAGTDGSSSSSSSQEQKLLQQLAGEALLRPVRLLRQRVQQQQQHQTAGGQREEEKEREVLEEAQRQLFWHVVSIPLLCVRFSPSLWAELPLLLPSPSSVIGQQQQQQQLPPAADLLTIVANMSTLAARTFLPLQQQPQQLQSSSLRDAVARWAELTAHVLRLLPPPARPVAAAAAMDVDGSADTPAGAAGGQVLHQTPSGLEGLEQPRLARFLFETLLPPPPSTVPAPLPGTLGAIGALCSMYMRILRGTSQDVSAPVLNALTFGSRLPASLASLMLLVSINSSGSSGSSGSTIRRPLLDAVLPLLSRRGVDSLQVVTVEGQPVQPLSLLDLFGMLATTLERYLHVATDEDLLELLPADRLTALVAAIKASVVQTLASADSAAAGSFGTGGAARRLQQTPSPQQQQEQQQEQQQQQQQREQLLAAAGEVHERLVAVLSQLFDRNGRRPFCAAELWPSREAEAIVDAAVARQPDLVRVSMDTVPAADADDVPFGRLPLSRPSAASQVLQHVPFLLPFTKRVQLFEAFLRRDRLEQRGEWDEGIRARVRRTHLVEDGFARLFPLKERLKETIRVEFISEFGIPEAGVDGGGVFKEFFTELAKEAYKPEYGLFTVTPNNELYPSPRAMQLVPNAAQLYEFLGLVLGKAVYERILVDLPFAQFFLAKIQKKFNYVQDLPSLDPELHRNLLYLRTAESVSELGLTFAVDDQLFGQVITTELIPGGKNIAVTNENRVRYIGLLAHFKLNTQIAQQCQAFMTGLSSIIPLPILRLFSASELEVVIGGGGEMEAPINVADLRLYSSYSGGYTERHPTIQLLWQVVERLPPVEQRQFLFFVTSCRRGPLLGFSKLDPPFTIHQVPGDEERLPTASTCMNLLKLPPYSNIAQLEQKLRYAIQSKAGFDLS